MPSADPNYPRMMFHKTMGYTIVKSEEEEAALGPSWTRDAFASSLPPEDKPLPKPDPEPEEEPDEEEEEKPDEQPQEQQKTPIAHAPPAKKRGRLRRG